MRPLISFSAIAVLAFCSAASPVTTGSLENHACSATGNLPRGIGFGVNLHPGDVGEFPESARRAFDLAKDLGFTFLRTDFWWSELEPERDTWDEARLVWYRDYVRLALWRGLEVQAVLTGAPSWVRQLYSSDARAFFKEFREYCRKVARRFGKEIHYYQVWNEADSPRDFVRPWDDWKLFKAGREGIRAVDRDSETIVNFITAFPWWEFTLNCWMAMARCHVDIIGVDHYPGTWYFGRYEDWSPLETLMRKSLTPGDPCYGKKLAVQETGFSTFLPFFHSEADQKAWIERSLPSLRRIAREYSLKNPGGFVSCCFYELFDAGSKPGYWVEDFFGILRKDGSGKPGYESLKKEIRAFLGDGRFLR